MSRTEDRMTAKSELFAPALYERRQSKDTADSAP